MSSEQVIKATVTIEGEVSMGRYYNSVYTQGLQMQPRAISEIARARAVGQRAGVHAMSGSCAGDHAEVPDRPHRLLLPWLLVPPDLEALPRIP